MGKEAGEGRDGQPEGRGTGAAGQGQDHGAEGGAGEGEEGSVGAREGTSGAARTGGTGAKVPSFPVRPTSGHNSDIGCKNAKIRKFSIFEYAGTAIV